MLITVLIFSSCAGEKEKYSFLFVGHAYDWSVLEGNRVDGRLEKLDKGIFDGFWLGGDACSNTSLNPKTFKYLNKLFDLDKPNSHFVLGNHDVRDNNLDSYYRVLGKPDFYTSSFRNLVVSVLNTNLNSSNCEQLNAQYRMLENVADTISSNSNYVILMHHQVFSDIKGLESFKSNGICKYYSMNCYNHDSYFKDTVYPLLVNLEKQDVEVTVVVGDTGWHNGSAMDCDNGVTFIASGINNSYHLYKDFPLDKMRKDQVLIFDLSLLDNKLTWHFESINKLAKVNREKWFSQVR